MDLRPIGTAETISSNITKAIASIDEHLQDKEKRSQLDVTVYDGMLVYSFKDKKVPPLGTALKTELESHGYNVHGVLIAHAHKPGTLRTSTKKLLIYPRQPLKVIPANDPSTTDRNRPAREPYDLQPGYQAYEVSEPRIIPPPSEDGTGKDGADVICVVLK